MVSQQQIFFEPWGLGDALIAFAIALQRPDGLSVACQSRWHPLLRAEASVQALACPQLISVDLSYTGREKRVDSQVGVPGVEADGRKVLSIRGDIRDYRFARQMFPNASIKMCGWVPFAAKRSRIVDWPFAKGILPVLNRYHAWARLAAVPWNYVLRFYSAREAFTGSAFIVIHAGAQWRSKQFPHVAELAALLRQHATVEIAVGTGDPLPPGIDEDQVVRLANEALIERLSLATHVVANDSGPMHVAAMLRRRTVCVTNHSAMQEWLAPEVVLLAANGNKGHRATEVKPSDRVFPGWPTAEDVAKQVLALA